MVPLSPRLLLCPWASSRPSRGSLLLSLGSEPFLFEPKDVHLLWLRASLLSDSARNEALTGSSYSSCLLFSILGLFSCYFLLLYTQLPIRLQQNPSSLSPPISAQGSLTSSVIRDSGHITRRSPKSSRAELRNHLSGLGTQVSPSSSSCLHPCASGTLCG